MCKYANEFKVSSFELGTLLGILIFSPGYSSYFLIFNQVCSILYVCTFTLLGMTHRKRDIHCCSFTDGRKKKYGNDNYEHIKKKKM